MTQLRVDMLKKLFGGVHAIHGLSFEVDAGTVYSNIGPNGAGKTTLFNVIVGIYQPDGGRVAFDGEDVTALPPHALARRGISRTFQNLQVFFNMTALENVMVGRHLKCDARAVPALFRFRHVVRGEAESREAARELMDFVGIGEYADRPASAMPYGTLKRLEIARALGASPKMILLDEPAAGLNPAETAAVTKLIQAISATGTTVVLVEHDMHLVMEASDRILVLDHGRKLAEGTAAEIRTDPDVIAAYLGSSVGPRELRHAAN